MSPYKDKVPITFVETPRVAGGLPFGVVCVKKSGYHDVGHACHDGEQRKLTEILDGATPTRLVAVPKVRAQVGWGHTGAHRRRRRRVTTPSLTPGSGGHRSLEGRPR